MSIWCSSFELSDEGFEEGRDGPAPLAYRASHVFPTLGDFRSGSLDLAYIPGFVTDDGWCIYGVDHTHQERHEDCRCEPLNELPAVWPFLRVGVEEEDEKDRAVVILDRSQVEKLRDNLTDWLGRTK